MIKDSAPTFATIGHLETWEKVRAILNSVRPGDVPQLSDEEVRRIIPQIHPQAIARIQVRSYPRMIEANGIHIETFIPPEALTPGSIRRNIERVRAAAHCAVKENVGIAALGGFTSIVMEGKTSLLSRDTSVAFTTGNTLTTAFIVNSVEKAIALHGMSLTELRLLIVGSTGDIGSACARYFAGKTRQILLGARNPVRLDNQAAELRAMNVSVRAGTDLNELVPMADVIILVASTGQLRLQLDGLMPHTIVCDAGYPKNAADQIDDASANRIYSGGMGLVKGGFDISPDLGSAFYDFPLPNIGHGCTLEGALLALEGRFESYSTGRGNISVAAIEEIWTLAQAHGFETAPFFNSRGMWDVFLESPKKS